MYGLGDVSGGPTTSVSPSNLNGSRGGVLSVVRALGVLVCEGRIQGPPRGYREGPHCAAPLQSAPNNHVCEKENYLCNRYFVLVKEIADKTAIGVSLCVEVFMCSDCPCGLATATCNDPVSSIPSTSITQWPQMSEMLLEYWCIRVLPSKSSEIMNFQGLYQAVRSRLHFSQVAAWWSRSNGSKPTYVATRVVPCNTDNLRKFREQPIEHTFPLASIGDGNSVKVTVWALPRIEEVPELICHVHPATEKTEDDAARALTPTKNNTPSSTITQQPESCLVLPTLVDDRLQTSCDQPGKHHCRCEEEETSPPSPSIKPNGERKRRRSLPCGPSDVGSCVVSGNVSLASVSEIISTDSIEKQHENENHHRQDRWPESGCFDNQPFLGTTLERYFRTQVSLEDREGNDEKRYKPSSELVANYELLTNCNSITEQDNLSDQWKFQSFRIADNHGSTSSTVSRKPNVIVNPLHETDPSSSTFVYQKPFSPCNVHLKYDESSKNPLISERNDIQGIPSTDLSHLMSKLSFPKESVKLAKEEGGLLDWISKVPGRVLSGGQNSISSAPEKLEDNDIKVQETIGQDVPVKNCNGIKLKNCNLELSQREFNEVLAVLRTRTPSWRRRTPVKNSKRREKLEKLSDDGSFEYCGNSKSLSLEPSVCPIHRELKEAPIAMMGCGCCSSKPLNQNIDELLEKPVDSQQNSSNKADVLLGAILRTSRDRKGISDISNGSRSATTIPLDENDRGKQEHNHQFSQSNLRIIPFEDDKFLPSALNKRLIRLKQLFRKDQMPKVSTQSQNISQGMKDSAKLNHTTNNYLSNSKDSSTLKRKIELAKLKVNIRTDQFYEPLINETISPSHDFPPSHDTNLNFVEFEDDKVRENDCDLTLYRNGCGERNGNAANRLVNRPKDWKELSEHGKNVIYGEFEDEVTDRNVPSAIEQERFRRSLENAASMVFHSRTGLPLTSSPAPLRRGSCCFDYDSSLNTVSSKRSALFELNTPPSPGAVSLEEVDREVENIGEGDEPPKRSSSSRIRPQSHALLGSFEESALNGRLEPVSTVHGFTAEIGASGSFCPKHRKLPVTVFFYTLGDNDKVSTPYLAHINLGKKGYQVPRSGTIQVTLLNPLGTVVKMFVVVYDLSDMPPRSHTFLRQRTLRDKTLRYLVHLRFMSGKSGKVYLHTDIRMIICRKSDVDTASDFGSEPPKELRSYIHGPTNPKFSPRC